MQLARSSDGERKVIGRPSPLEQCSLSFQCGEQAAHRSLSHGRNAVERVLTASEQQERCDEPGGGSTVADPQLAAAIAHPASLPAPPENLLPPVHLSPHSHRPQPHSK